MSTMIAEVYDALLAAGAPDDKARAAAAAVATEANLGKIETRLDRVEARLDRVEARLAKVETDLAVVKWMCATNSAIGVGILLKLFLS